MNDINGYHAHIYFDENSIDRARELCTSLHEEFGVSVGHFHQRLVGPHPRWSVQIAFAPEDFARVIPWLMTNRSGLTVFTHPETGDDLTDHTEHSLWMGEMLPLKLDIFRREI